MIKNVIHYKAGSYLPVTENWIFNKIKNLKRYKAIFYCHGTENLDVYPVEKIRSLDLKPKIKVFWIFFNLVWNKIFKFYPLFAFFLLKDKPDLIHAHFGPSGYNFLRLKKIFRLPLITSFYGQDLSMLPQQHPEWKKRYKELFEDGDIFLVEGSHMKQCLINLGCPKEKIIVQHLGVNLDKIRFTPRKLKKNESVKVLIAASFREKKGIPDAIEAFGKVKNNNPDLNMKLTIIGDSRGSLPEEKEKKKILSEIKKYHLKSSVSLSGYQPHSVFLVQLYKHHIFLSPSVTASDGDTEGGVPVSIIEASASGMPILSTTHCDIPEVILDKKSGFLVPERDVNTLVKKLEFLVKNPQEWFQLEFNGRKHIEKEYAVKKQIVKLEEIYDSLLKNKLEK